MQRISDTDADNHAERGATHDVGPDSGFTVLEALIAIALLAAAFIPLLEIQSQFVRVTETLDRTQTRMSQEKFVHNFLSTVNFDLQPTGSVILNNMALEWSVETVSRPRAVKIIDGAHARFAVTLYDVDVRYFPRNSGLNSPARTYSMQGIGWTARRPVIEGF